MSCSLCSAVSTDRATTWIAPARLDAGAQHSGRTPEQVRDDIERDKILSAAAAKDYGLIDAVLTSRKATLDWHSAVG